jgi:hypothetical protein
MELVLGERNRTRLSEVLKLAMEKTDYVEAAIAYVSDDQTLIKECFSKNVPLKLFGRYDYSQPVAYKILSWFLARNSGNYVCKLVPDIFHPKIIWWHGFGVYIGSANLTDRAWFKNFEAGVFLTEDELEEEGLAGQLAEYFEELNANAHPLTREILEEAKFLDSEGNPFWKAKKAAMDAFKGRPRLIPPLASLASINKRPSRQRLREKFLKEWNSTIEILRGLAQKTADLRPAWINADVPPGILVDRFLHDYYYFQVKDGQKHPFHDFHQKNFKRTEQATNEALTWWSGLPGGSVGEIERLHEWPVILKPLLQKDRLLKLTVDQLETLFFRVNAIRDHALRVSWRSYGLAAPLPRMELEDRVHQLAKYVFAQRSEDGSTAGEILAYVIYGGPDSEIPNRMFECWFAPKKIRHMGISAYGEIVGCAKPEYSPPRNGRTSKALYALGYDVTIHSGG